MAGTDPHARTKIAQLSIGYPQQRVLVQGQAKLARRLVNAGATPAGPAVGPRSGSTGAPLTHSQPAIMGADDLLVYQPKKVMPRPWIHQVRLIFNSTFVRATLEGPFRLAAHQRW